MKICRIPESLFQLWGEVSHSDVTRGAVLCCFEPYCPDGRGRCALGPIEGDAACETRALRCLDCGRTGWQSKNLRLVK